MQILIATPLYPPDTAETAQYVKELAQRLSTKHKVSVVLYGHLPEKVSNVRTLSIDKRKPTYERLFSFLWTLLREIPRHDMLYIVNGRSVEIPAYFVTRLRKIPYTFLPFDSGTQITVFGKILRDNSQKKISYHDTSLTRPEILPFKDYPEDAMRMYEENWKQHLKELL